MKAAVASQVTGHSATGHRGVRGRLFRRFACAIGRVTEMYSFCKISTDVGVLRAKINDHKQIRLTLITTSTNKLICSNAPRLAPRASNSN